jgi:hypothetical protein
MARVGWKDQVVRAALPAICEAELTILAARIGLRDRDLKASPNELAAWAVQYLLGRGFDQALEIASAGKAREETFRPRVKAPKKAPKPDGGGKKSGFPDGLHAVAPSIAEHQVNRGSKRRTLGNNPDTGPKRVPLP